MFALVGLKNPGAKYADTRHNAGAWLVEHAAQSLGLGNPENDWKSKFDSRFARVELEGEECLLVLPDSYMNESGGPVSQLIRFFKIPPERLVVAHDDLDLPPGGLRLKMGGSNGGHNGLADITNRIGTPKFLRIRIGIGRPDVEGEGRGRAVSNWVLSTPQVEDRDAIQEAAVRGYDSFKVLIAQGLVPAQNAFHGMNSRP